MVPQLILWAAEALSAPPSTSTRASNIKQSPSSLDPSNTLYLLLADLNTMKTINPECRADWEPWLRSSGRTPPWSGIPVSCGVGTLIRQGT